MTEIDPTANYIDTGVQDIELDPDVPTQLPTRGGGSEVIKPDPRRVRADILQGTDWTQVSDSPLSDEKKAEWATYRQALRDITNDPAFPDVDFPSPPSV